MTRKKIKGNFKSKKQYFLLTSILVLSTFIILFSTVKSLDKSPSKPTITKEQNTNTAPNLKTDKTGPSPDATSENSKSGAPDWVSTNKLYNLLELTDYEGFTYYLYWTETFGVDKEGKQSFGPLEKSHQSLIRIKPNTIIEAEDIYKNESLEIVKKEIDQYIDMRTAPGNVKSTTSDHSKVVVLSWCYACGAQRYDVYDLKSSSS